jgi:predicted nucleic acid-binding protein
VAIFADTSAVVRAYLVDEPDHAALAEVLLEGPEPVVISALAEVEIVSALARATRDGRLGRSLADRILAAFAADTASDGPLAVAMFDAVAAFAAARRLPLKDRLRMLDALQLAAAPALAATTDEELAFCTRDKDQAAAARAERFCVL